MNKIHTTYYVLFDYERERYYDGGLTHRNEWVDNLEYCFYLKDLDSIREVKNEIKKYYGIECIILKVELLEVE